VGREKESRIFGSFGHGARGWTGGDGGKEGGMEVGGDFFDKGVGALGGASANDSTVISSAIFWQLYSFATE